MPANKPSPHASTNDIDFVEAMHELPDMDEKAVEELLEKLDADELQELMDAVAKEDRDAASEIIQRFNTDEEVNALFRGENLEINDKKKKPVPSDASTQFAIGDDVLVTLSSADGKTEKVSATVSQPQGPEGTDTIIVSIKGKSKVVDKTDVAKLEEGVIGIIGVPNLSRMQKLAGIAPSEGQLSAPDEVDTSDTSSVPSQPMQEAMDALDTLEAVLPNIVLSDLKTVRQRLTAIQVMMNESVDKPSRGRLRKL
jgi:hypothetical protein